VVMYYLNQVWLQVKDDEKVSVPSTAWDFLESELRICDRNAEEIPFLWSEMKIDDEKQKRRRKRQVPSTNITETNILMLTAQQISQKSNNPDNYVLPDIVKVDLDASGSWETGVPLYYYEDAAELDFELNIPIDLHFKVFATVAGYCNLHYTQRKSETFPRLYSTYYEDIFSPIEEIWMNPRDTGTMKFIFSEYTDEAVVKWIDSCLEGSYIISNSPTYRPPRPLIIPEGENHVANYFLDEPPSRVVLNQRQTTTMSPDTTTLNEATEES